jgi:hypothetical protein
MVRKETPNSAGGSPRDRVIKRKATVVRTALTFITIADVLIFAYVGSVIYSVSRTSVVLDDTSTYAYNVNTPSISDDTIDYYLNLSLSNQGIYPIQAITLHVEVYIHNSTDILLPAGTHFGDLDQVIPAVLPGNTTSLTLTLAIDAEYGIIYALLYKDVWMRIEFTIATAVQQFAVRVNGTFLQLFDSGF